MVQELLVAWLNDARAIEKAQVRTLRRLTADFEEFDEIRSELRQHVTEVEEAIDDLEEAIRGLGGEIIENAFTANNITDPGGVSPFHDELVKDILRLHASEHFGYINYLALAECASHLGQDEVVDMCERAAEEKRIMAEWAEEQLPTVITNCLHNVSEEE
jgi:ferritin-like metal-binding protein YciE